MHLIKQIAHRPYPLTSKNWIMRQSWRDLLFIHWPVPLEEIRKHVPSSLHIDTFDGSAWLSIVIFEMKGIYIRGLPPFSILPPFPEINVRTYVHHNGKPGVYFMSLDVNDWMSYTVAKRWLHLPYQPANISIQKDENTYHYSSNRAKQSNSSITSMGSYTPSQKVFFPINGTLEHWLTERYCFFSESKKGVMYCCEIHHLPWPLQNAEFSIKKNTLIDPFQIDLASVGPISYFSNGVDSLIWNIQKLKKQ